jgi:hypothetical protein
LNECKDYRTDPFDYKYVDVLPNGAAKNSVAVTMDRESIRVTYLSRGIILEGENFCATVVYHENIHRGEPEWLFTSKLVCFSELNAYGETLRAATITGLDAHPEIQAEVISIYMTFFFECMFYPRN